MTVTIDADHPSLAGHFPDDPVLPAVVILEQVQQCIRNWLENGVDTGSLESAKFPAPLVMDGGEDRRLSVELQRHASHVDFRCLSGPLLIARGRWRLIQAS